MSPVHSWDGIPSANYQSLQAVISTMDIEDDPAVIALRTRLSKLPPGDDRRRVDQKLSKTIDKQDTFTHKGLRDFARTAEDICIELGPWAADWYVARVIERAKEASNPYNNIMSAWQEREKSYLLSVISRIRVVEPSDDPVRITEAVTDKVRKLVYSLVEEEAIFRSLGEDYSGLIFVTRRDTVLVLGELLRRIPATSQLFRVGCLLGSSASFKRHSFLDITRSMLDESQSDTLRDFKIGDKNLIVSTSVAEEGIDIQACGSVVRFDVPPNVVSWAQSRGRARRKRSSFIIMFEQTGPQDVVRKWEETEQQMMAAYNDPSRDMMSRTGEEDEGMDGYVEFEVASTGFVFLCWLLDCTNQPAIEPSSLYIRLYLISTTSVLSYPAVARIVTFRSTSWILRTITKAGICYKFEPESCTRVRGVQLLRFPAPCLSSTYLRSTRTTDADL